MNTSSSPIRVGLIVPSSNVTIETELPRLLARHASVTFTFHSSRMRMQEVSEEALRAAYTLLNRLGLPTVLPGAGRLLAQDKKGPRTEFETQPGPQRFTHQ
jgi:hypothetical protein